MPDQKNELSRLTDLVDQYFAKSICAKDFEELQALLVSRADYRERFRRLVQVHAGLHELADAGALDDGASTAFQWMPSGLQGSDSDFTEQVVGGVSNPLSIALGSGSQAIQSTSSLATVDGSRRNFMWMGAGTVLSASVFLVALLLLRRSDSQLEEKASPVVLSEFESNSRERALIPTPVSLNEPAVALAVIQSDSDAIWEDGQRPWRRGDVLSGQTVRLSNGVVEFALMNGAVAIIEGPAEFQMVSSDLGVLNAGRARFYVPDSASSLVLNVAGTRFTNLGIEFGIDARKSHELELHVFEGTVVAEPRDGSQRSRLVGAGAGLAISVTDQERDFAWTSIQADPSLFTDARQLAIKEEHQNAVRFQTWKQYAAEMSRDPELVVFYDFQRDPAKDRALVDKSVHGRDGAIVGCKWTKGRWTGKDSLEFKRPTDRVRIEIPGAFDSLTMSAWVRVDGFDRMFNSLMLTDRFEHGDLHWQIRSTGQMDVGMKPSSDQPRGIMTSDRGLGYQDLGQWVHLAVTVDQSAGLISHFVNGRLITAGSWDFQPPTEAVLRNPVKLRLGKAEIGNWSPTRRYDAWPIRNFNGCIDEFLVHSRALSASRILEIFQAGKPGATIAE